MKKTLLLITMICLFAVPIASALIGVGHPRPETLELLAGEEGRVEWQIQNVGGDEDLVCNEVTEQVNENLQIIYDEEGPYDIKSNSIKSILLSVWPLEDLPAGHYEQEFCVECTSPGEVSGVSVKPRFCTTAIKVDVVKVRSKQNYPLPPRPAPEESNLGLILGVIIAIAVIVGLLMIVMRPKKSPKRKKKSPVQKKVKPKKKNAKRRTR